MLTQERVKHLFDYDPETGLLTRSISTSGHTRVGAVVGSDNGNGHLQVKIDYKFYMVHRIIWLWVYGKFPEHQTDHINHDRADNRISNLRDVTFKENQKNKSMRCTNTSGVTGVSWHKRDHKWQGEIMANGKRIHLGCFEDKSEAAAVRKIAEIKYGYHENHGKPVEEIEQ